MTTRSEELRQSIATERRELGRRLDRLQERLHDTTDVKGYVERHPGPMLGVALGAGLLLGVATGGGRRSGALSDEYVEAGGQRARRGVRGGAMRGGADQLRSALFGMAAARLSEFVFDRVADYMARPGRSSQHHDGAGPHAVRQRGRERMGRTDD